MRSTLRDARRPPTSRSGVACVAGADRSGPAVAAALRTVADRVECSEDLTGPGGVGSAYVDFRQTEDAEVLALLAAARGRSGSGASSVRSPRTGR